MGLRYKICKYENRYAIRDKWHKHLIRKDGEDKPLKSIDDALLFDYYAQALLVCSMMNNKLNE